MNINLYGELPTKSCVMAACDSNYLLEHGVSFVKSASDNNKHVHVHVVNPTEEAIGFSSILHSICETNLTFTYNDFKFPDDWDEDNKRSLYACLRFLIAPQIIQSVPEHVTILDIDSIIMEDFKIPMSKLVGYFPRDPLPGTVGWEREGTKVAAGGIFYKKDKRTIEISYRVAREIEKLPLKWFVDQIALNTVYSDVEEQEPNIFYKFDSKFMDWEFKEGTSIWTGKGPRKYDNPTYVSKKESYGSAIEQLKNYDAIILEPRLDIMMKKSLCKSSSQMSDPEIRKYWKKYSERIQKENPNNLVVTSPRWMFKEEMLKYFNDNATIYVPHVEKKYWGGDNRCRFYMQTVFPWLFTEDEEGWAGGAKFIETYNPKLEYTDDTFDSFSKYSKDGGSKYRQPKSNDVLTRGKSVGIPLIFVPLQIPNDMTLKYHSDIGVWEFANKLVDWAEENPDGPHIVFKFHPGMSPDIPEAVAFLGRCSNISNVGIRIGDEISIHKLFKECEAVYVINSGTGQEAMLWDVPVVTFGRADYTPAVIEGKINDLDFTWDAVLHDDKEKRKQTYRRWYDWYVNDICVDLGKG